MTRFDMTRRDLIKRSGLMAAGSVCAPVVAVAATTKKHKADWAAMREDPVRKMISGKPDLDRILRLFPRVTGKAAFDRALIAENISRLKTEPAIETGHSFVDLSVKTGLAHIDATFRGDRPKYGVGAYEADRHDGFPLTIIAAVDALSAWAVNVRAAQLFRYWPKIPFVLFARDLAQRPFRLVVASAGRICGKAKLPYRKRKGILYELSLLA